ncbi:hypothetical protein EJ08DRAFT_332518 [Tothia fuscella]|uniref:RRN6 beta-propeller domain-containing protein n=1 Tax=Tothia fuscella TaxID=1048955 RepID=A0A9P4NM72_9PEZI|nr:hypothetical protein EJ08DRAFT_332518 [Tothia fuscella]
MVKSSLRELLYGHAGRAIYNEQYDDWSLGRDGKTFHQLPQLGKTKRLLKGTGDLAAEETVLDTARDEEDRYDRSLKRCIELLIRGYPELAPAHRLLGVEHRVSERIAKGVAKYDPAKGNLIAYGSVSNMHEDDDGHVSFVPLLALPGGRCGEALRLVRLEEQTHGWEKEYEGRELEPLSPSREVGWWVGKGAPILHIVFAESLDDTGSDFLAVRLQGVTIILEPCYERRMIPPSGASLDRPYPPSRVHAKPVFEITPESSLSGVHADVSFNPWDHEQFATVDDQGYWAIFGVDKVHKKGKLRQHELQGHGHSGKFDWEEGLEDEDIILEPDGWGRIFWAGSETTLVVCIRQQIVILDMETKTVTPVKLPELYGMRPGIHLDCLRCPGKPQWFFLLTTKQLIWFEVLDLDLNDAAVGRRKEKTKILHSTRHFRNPLDISLHLKVLVEDDNILVLLASRFNEAVTCFRFNTSSDRFLLPGWASDPTPLTLPVPKKARSSLLDFSIVPVQAVGADAEEIISEEEETSSDDEEEEIWELPSQAVEHEDLDDDDEDMVDERAVPDPPRFYGLQILKRDFSLNHVMLQSKPDKDSKVHSNPPTPLLQSIETHSATGRVGSLRRSWEPRDEMDDFIVEDDIELERAKYWDPISEEIPRFKVTYKKKNPQTKKQLFENRKRGPTLNKERVMHKMCQSLRQGDTTLLWEDLEAITSDLEGLVLAREEGLGLPSVTLTDPVHSKGVGYHQS